MTRRYAKRPKHSSVDECLFRKTCSLHISTSALTLVPGYLHASLNRESHYWDLGQKRPGMTMGGARRESEPGQGRRVLYRRRERMDTDILCISIMHPWHAAIGTCTVYAHRIACMLYLLPACLPTLYQSRLSLKNKGRGFGVELDLISSNINKHSRLVISVSDIHS